jgi:hypothetical protein
VLLILCVYNTVIVCSVQLSCMCQGGGPWDDRKEQARAQQVRLPLYKSRVCSIVIMCGVK